MPEMCPLSAGDVQVVWGTWCFGCMLFWVQTVKNIHKMYIFPLVFSHFPVFTGWRVTICHGDIPAQIVDCGPHIETDKKFHPFCPLFGEKNSKILTGGCRLFPVGTEGTYPPYPPYQQWAIRTNREPFVPSVRLPALNWCWGGLVVRVPFGGTRTTKWVAYHGTRTTKWYATMVREPPNQFHVYML